MAAKLHRDTILRHPLPELPSEIIFDHILPWLPGKSILRFKCVSKQWYAFLTTPMFKKLHFDHINKDDHHNPNKLLVRLHKYDNKHIYYSDLMLWNPLNGEYKTLSKFGGHYELIYMCRGRAFGLYYSYSDDDYKLLRVADGAFIYSLKSDSWRKLCHSKYNVVMFVNNQHWSHSIWLNDKLYFLIEYLGSNLSKFHHIIIRFDTKTENFTAITTPSFENIRPHISVVESIYIGTCYKGTRQQMCGFSVVRGRILFFVTFFKNCSLTDRMELWNTDEDGDGGWTKVETYSKLESFLPEFKTKPVVHMMRNGNWIMHSRDEGYFSQVDLEKSIKDVSCSYVSSSMYRHILLQGKYVETFVSPNRYMN
ncbi:F-box protein At3g22700-like [Bidens hawaiensis]|uniref:F-box protein At3g22700-like n=1 Tax=Bidens hawaiensis TaxID=980011 RepID=UPI0040497E23